MAHEQHHGSRFAIAGVDRGASIISINTFITVIFQAAQGFSCRKVLQLYGSGYTCMIDEPTRAANLRNGGGVLRYAPRGARLTSRRNMHPDGRRASMCRRYRINIQSLRLYHPRKCTNKLIVSRSFWWNLFWIAYSRVFQYTTWQNISLLGGFSDKEIWGNQSNNGPTNPH